MRLTTKQRYAVTALLDVAMHQQQGAVALKDVAARQQISLAYLEQLFAKLRRRELVKSVRGPGGGYLIIPQLDKLTVAQVIAAVEAQSENKSDCGNICHCDGSKLCLTHKLWSDLSRVMQDFLESVTFAKLVANK